MEVDNAPEYQASINNADADTTANDVDLDFSLVLEGLQKKSALFILEIKERYRLTQAAVEGIIQGATGLIQVSTVNLFLSDCVWDKKVVSVWRWSFKKSFCLQIIEKIKCPCYFRIPQ